MFSCNFPPQRDFPYSDRHPTPTRDTVAVAVASVGFRHHFRSNYDLYSPAIAYTLKAKHGFSHRATRDMIQSANDLRLLAAMDRNREHEVASSSSSVPLSPLPPLAFVNSLLAHFVPRQSGQGQIHTSSPIFIVQLAIATIFGTRSPPWKRAIISQMCAHPARGL